LHSPGRDGSNHYLPDIDHPDRHYFETFVAKSCVIAFAALRLIWEQFHFHEVDDLLNALPNALRRSVESAVESNRPWTGIRRV
jgi:hypothetical protein